MIEAAQHLGSAGGIGDAFTIVNAVIDTAFLVSYCALARWWKSFVGVHLFAFVSILDAIWIISAIHHFLGWDSSYYPARAVLYCLFAPVGIWRLRLLFDAQTHQRKADAEAGRQTGRGRR